MPNTLTRVITPIKKNARKQPEGTKCQSKTTSVNQRRKREGNQRQSSRHSGQRDRRRQDGFAASGDEHVMCLPLPPRVRLATSPPPCGKRLLVTGLAILSSAGSPESFLRLRRNLQPAGLPDACECTSKFPHSWHDAPRMPQG
eukprot:3286819-Prymnesium_polylepis.2